MSVSKEQPGKEKAYSDEDQKLIIALLKEYSERLLDVCERRDRSKDRSFLILVFFLIALCIGLSLFSFLILGFGSTSYMLLLISCAFYLFTLVLISNYYSKNLFQKTVLLSRDAEILSIKLEKVIRAASQAHEHVVSNFVGRLELDLRLTDAESALQRYKVPKIHNGKIL
jgi:hypothetical protein